MLTGKMTADQERWCLTQVKPAPEVIVLAYCGTSWKEWKVAWMGIEAEFCKVDDIEAMVLKQYPSTMLIKVYHLEGNTKLSGGERS